MVTELQIIKHVLADYETKLLEILEIKNTEIKTKNSFNELSKVRDR